MRACILIIEDDVPSLTLAKYLLEAAGHSTLAATDGLQGATLAMTARVDLVMCDLHIPVMNGFEVLARLRSTRNWPRVPMIAVTASSMAGAREKILAAGFDGYISKPITPETFVAQIEEFLASNPARDPT